MIPPSNNPMINLQIPNPNPNPNPLPPQYPFPRYIPNPSNPIFVETHDIQQPPQKKKRIRTKPEIVDISSNVNEIFATTEVNQSFINELEKPIELSVTFPINKKLTLTKFVVSIDDKVIISKIMPKEKAEEKYSDSIASGNVGFISRYNDDYKSYSVNIGNLEPKKEVKLKSIFIEMIGSQDLSYEFNIMEDYPGFYFEDSEYEDDYSNKIINANFTIETQSKITRLISPFLSELTDKKYTYNIKYSQDYKKAEVEYKNENPKIEFDKGDEEEEKNLCILFRTENMSKPILYSQYNPELKETAFSINYTYISKYLKEIPIPDKPDEDSSISYATKYEENIVNETPGLFVFLIDQSGSMSGNAIILVRKALLLFIQSLPEESYFQLIGFGSEFKKYNPEPVIYNKENVEKIIKVINDLSADMGGTNISNPLREIYNDNIYSKINLSKTIFLLTDGEVFDREECINLIKTNSEKFRIQALGLGNSFDEVLIRECGKLGKGSSYFVKDNENINSAVIHALNESLRPYITNLKFEFENYKEEISSSIISCNPLNDFTYQNEVMNYSFILPGNKDLSNLKIKITGKDPINSIKTEHCFDNTLKLNDGEELGKMIVGKALKYNEELSRDEKKEIEFAKKYQILSKNTALFAKILKEEKEQSDELIKVNIVKKKKEIPNMPSMMQRNPIYNLMGMPGMKMGMQPDKPMMMFNNMNNNMMMFNNMMNNNMMNNNIATNQPTPPKSNSFNNNMMNNNNINHNMMNNNMMNNNNINLNMMNNNNNMMNNMNNNNMMNNNMNNNMMMNNMGMNSFMAPLASLPGVPHSVSMANNVSWPMNNLILHSPNNMMINSIKSNSEIEKGPDPFLYGKEFKNLKINKKEKEEGKEIKKQKKDTNKDLNLIMSQDIIEGSWNENDETKKLIYKITLDKFNKIKNKISSLNKGDIETKIIYTIIVIYYLNMEYPDDIDEFKLVINKANKFLMKNGIDYDNIVSDL